MRFSSNKSLLPLLLTLPVAAGDLHISVDDSLARPIAIREVVEEVVDELPGEPVFKTPQDAPRYGSVAPVEERDLLASTGDILDVLLDKRQSCSPDYGYCSRFGRCCPTQSRCCNYGYCLSPGLKCCPSAPCERNQNCCGRSHCSPIGGACCSDESSCELGNNCYRLNGRVVCCTNSRCTAHVTNGITSYATTRTTTRTTRYPSTRYFYWTVTYWYWYYYWTYSVAVDASVVTSTRSTTTTRLSVLTTDAAAASKYFSSISDTMLLPTPAEATVLESLAGQTSAKSEPLASQTSAESSSPSRTATIATTPTSSLAVSDSDLRDMSSTRATNTGPTLAADGDGPMNAARALWSGLSTPTMALLALGVGVGVVAAIL